MKKTAAGLLVRTAKKVAGTTVHRSLFPWTYEKKAPDAMLEYLRQKPKKERD